MNQKVKQLAESLLKNWIAQDKGEGLYKYAGGYWELLYPIFKKYTPDLLKRYENMLMEDFSYFNDDVRNLLDTGDEETNILEAIQYINDRIDSMASPQDVHYIELEDDEIIPYIPNQNIDIDNFWGRYKE